MKSFRTRLALLSALISAVIIAGFSAAGYFLFERMLLESVDSQLAIPIDRISRELHPWADFRRISNNADIMYGNDIEDGKLLLMIHEVRPDEIIYQNPEGDWHNSIDEDLWKKSVNGETQPPPPGNFKGKGGEGPVHPFEHFGPKGKGEKGEKGKGKGKGNHPQRPGPPPEVKYYFLDTADQHWRVGIQYDRGFTVVMAKNLSGFEAKMSQILRMIFIAAPGCLLLIGLGGWFVGDRAMKPLTAITETAGNITARELHERIPVKRGEFHEFSNLISVLNRMMDRLEKGFSHAVRFSADVSHELKTPITIMQAELNTALKECEPGSKEEKALEVISAESHRLKAITGSLMLLSQAESGRLALKKQKISLSEEVADLAEDAEILCEKDNLTLESDIAENIEVNTDSTLLHQALLNLISNAVKYNEPGGWIKMSLTSHDLSKEAVFRISNSGPGIPDEDQSQIFERFYRVNKARDRSVDGFGLGLNLSREIFQALDGELELIKADQNQTVFQVRLPMDS
ncbi:MAG: ATP-binding protein [Verrucomicrobiales bacterium]|nr:ATP-binding protein [Verrucomicrobiales bacterium]